MDEIMNHPKPEKREVIMIDLRVTGTKIMIHNKPAIEIWREAEQVIAGIGKKFRLQYSLTYKTMPIECGIFSGEWDVPQSFRHGDFAQHILDVLAGKGEFIKYLSPKRQKQVMDYYFAFHERHLITVTTPT